MDWFTILNIMEALISFILIATVAWFQQTTPPWIYTFAMFWAIYVLVRLILSLTGMTRVSVIYAINMAIILALFYYSYRRWM